MICFVIVIFVIKIGHMWKQKVLSWMCWGDDPTNGRNRGCFL